MTLFDVVAIGLSFTHSLAMAGGGGSGGGGGGGGSSSDSGSGGGGFLIFVGYFPLHFIGVAIRKLFGYDPKVARIVGIVITTILAVAAMWGLILGLGGLGVWVGIQIVFGMYVGVWSGVANWWGQIGALAQKAKKDQELAAAKDSAWDMNAISSTVHSTFTRYEADWSKNDASLMNEYLTPEYYQHNVLMVQALKDMKRQNIVGNPQISSLTLLEVEDVPDNDDDRFVIAVKGTADDQLVDMTDNKLLFRQNPNNFTEYWQFARHGDNWLLDGIGQPTADPYMRNNELAAFAKKYGYFYSLDWGWLLLPRRGQLFGRGRFGVSDINNHVIGAYNNIVIQLYNYRENPNNSSTPNHLIAQAALPKSYGDIVVRYKRAMQLGIRGLTRVSMEWGDFNKKFEVWASDLERVTSFELLNPTFMEKLAAVPFKVNIEVVDNVVYLYSADAAANTSENYELLLALLREAFNEMRL